MGKKVHVQAVDDGRISPIKGDVDHSYSADLIAYHGTIRRPFELNGQRYTVVSSGGTGGVRYSEAYRVVPRRTWHSRTRRYVQMQFDRWRNDPRGFYNGMQVKYLREDLVLVGPPVMFYYKRNLPFREGEPPAGWNIWDDYAERHYRGTAYPRNNQRHTRTTDIPLLAGLHAAPGFCSRGMMLRDPVQIRV